MEICSVAMDKPLTDEEVRRIREALLLSWSGETCLVFDPKYPYYSQCAQTAIVVQRRYGGEILRTTVRTADVHIYNCIGGVRQDFTKEQYEIPDNLLEVEYLDIPMSADEAGKWTSPRQVNALWCAFCKALDG
jgi:hypothetical protein